MNSGTVKIPQILQWIISNQASKSDMIGHEEGSTTKWFWV
jgi:hypothetical protein